MNKRHFGLIELIGSIVLLLIEPNRRGNRKYLKSEFIKANRIAGLITLTLFFSVLIFYLVKFIL